MTNKFNSLTVVLENDIREDDAQKIIDAIYQLRGVIKVSGNVADLLGFVGTSRAKHDLAIKMLSVLKDE